MKNKTSMLTVVAAIFAAFGAFADVVTWIGETENSIDGAGDWNEPSNWQGEVVPGAGDVAKFGKWVKISGNQTIECDLVAESSARLVIGENSTVTLNGSYATGGGGVEVAQGSKLTVKGNLLTSASWGVNTALGAAGGTFRIESGEVGRNETYLRGGALEVATAAELNLRKVESADCTIRLDSDAKFNGNKEFASNLEIDLNGHTLEMLYKMSFGATATARVKNGNAGAEGTIVYKGDTAAGVKVCHDAGEGKVNVVVDADTWDITGARFEPTDGFAEGGRWNGTLEFRSGEAVFNAGTVEQTYADWAKNPPIKAKKVRWYLHSSQVMDANENPDNLQYPASGLAVSEFEFTFKGEPLAIKGLAGKVKIYKLNSTGEVEGEAISDPGSSVTQKIDKMFDGDVSSDSKWYVERVKAGDLYANGVCVEFDFGAEEIEFTGYRWGSADVISRDPKDVTMKVWDAAVEGWNAVFVGMQTVARGETRGAWHPGVKMEAEMRPVAGKLGLVVTAPAKATVDFSGEDGLTVSGSGELTVAAGCAPVAVTMASGVKATVKAGADAARTVDLGGVLSVAGGTAALAGPVRYVRWRITGVRGGDGATELAVSEFQLTKEGKPLAWPEGTEASCTVAGANNQKEDKLIDNLVNGAGYPLKDANVGNSIGGTEFRTGTENGNKYYTTGFRKESGLDFVITLPGPMEFDGYVWYTSSDSPKRDPKTWTVAVSADGEGWQEVSSVDFGFPGDGEALPDPNNLQYGHREQNYSQVQGRGKVVGALDASGSAVASPFAAAVEYGAAGETDVLDDAAAVTVPAGAGLTVASAVETCGGLNGAGTVTMSGEARLTLNTGAGVSGAFSGRVEAAGGSVLVIAGGGVQSLEGAVLDGVKEIVLEGGTLTGAFSSATAVKVTFAGGVWGATLTVAEGAGLTLAAAEGSKAKFRLGEDAAGEPYLKAFAGVAAADEATTGVFMAGEAVGMNPRYSVRKMVKDGEFILKGAKKGMLLLIK